MHSSKNLVRRSRVRRSASEWRDIFQQFSHSGQTQEIFCAEQSLALSTFNRWRQRLTGSTELVADQAASFIELSSCEEPPSTTPWDVELQLGADIIIRLRHPC